MLSDLRESGAIEQDADLVLFIYRDEVYDKRPDNPRRGIAELILGKHRNGRTGSVELAFLPQYTAFGGTDAPERRRPLTAAGFPPVPPPVSRRLSRRPPVSSRFLSFPSVSFRFLPSPPAHPFPCPSPVLFRSGRSASPPASRTPPLAALPASLFPAPVRPVPSAHGENRRQRRAKREAGKPRQQPQRKGRTRKKAPVRRQPGGGLGERSCRERSLSRKIALAEAVFHAPDQNGNLFGLGAARPGAGKGKRIVSLDPGLHGLPVLAMHTEPSSPMVMPCPAAHSLMLVRLTSWPLIISSTLLT